MLNPFAAETRYSRQNTNNSAANHEDTELADPQRGGNAPSSSLSSSSEGLNLITEHSETTDKSTDKSRESIPKSKKRQLVKTSSIATVTPNKLLQPNTPNHGGDKKLSLKA